MNHLLSHYRIRKLWPLENGAFRRHLLRLDGETRQFRFGTPVNDNFLDAYADTARRIGTVIYGAFIGPEMYASAELRALHIVGDGMAEAAFVCESAHRHNGLGSALMERIITAAQNRGIHQLHMICARENQAMQRLAVNGVDLLHQRQHPLPRIGVEGGLQLGETGVQTIEEGDPLLVRAVADERLGCLGVSVRDRTPRRPRSNRPCTRHGCRSGIR